MSSDNSDMDRSEETENELTSVIHVRCTPEEKAYWIKWLRENDGGKISNYIRALMPKLPDNEKAVTA